MVTGSHNPPEYNGIKIMLGGKPFFGDDIAALPARAKAGKFISGAGRLENFDVITPYVSYLLAEIHDNPKMQKLRIGWDSGNGAAGEIIEKLVKNLPATHFVINSKIDGTFPAHHPDPSKPENLQQLKQLVLDEGLDLGIAFDGDGDRLGALDVRGNILYGDQLLMLLAYDVLQATPNCIIMGDVKTSATAFARIKDYGGVPQMVATGHSLVKTAMQNHNGEFAAEMSGHIFYRENHYFDDALYAAIKLMNRIADADQDFTTLIDALPESANTPEIRITVPESEKMQIMQNIINAAKQQGLIFSDIDGIRIDDGAEWWLIRASNTENSLVFRAEAENDAHLKILIKNVMNFLKPFLTDITALERLISS